ncbi:hypothetical protein [Baekduia soli]|uniref:hypothetical protein n=1 Tax=Baekduia soli TaxID=496014 RepID=UPI001651C706|nr:hypothetical protein [Baekduia soli]
MGLAAAITAALAVWIIGWALGAKSIDSFMIAVVIMVIAATVKLLQPYVPKRNR